MLNDFKYLILYQASQQITHIHARQHFTSPTGAQTYRRAVSIGQILLTPNKHLFLKKQASIDPSAKRHSGDSLADQ